jgi:triosephosphate isomerase
MHWEKGVALTGEINAAMLEALQVKHVVIGHSERRQWSGESDAMVAKPKEVAAVLQVGLNPILSIGETLAERDGNRVEEILWRQFSLERV